MEEDILTEQKKQKIREEGFKDLKNYIYNWEDLEEQTEQLERFCDSRVDKLMLGYSFETRTNAVNYFKELMKKYGGDFVDHTLSSHYSVIYFDKLVRRFDRVHKELSEIVGWYELELEQKAETSA